VRGININYCVPRCSIQTCMRMFVFLGMAAITLARQDAIVNRQRRRQRGVGSASRSARRFHPLSMLAPVTVTETATYVRERPSVCADVSCWLRLPHQSAEISRMPRLSPYLSCSGGGANAEVEIFLCFCRRFAERYLAMARQGSGGDDGESAVLSFDTAFMRRERLYIRPRQNFDGVEQAEGELRTSSLTTLR